MIANEYVGGSSLANLVPKMGVAKLNPTAFMWSVIVVIIGFVCMLAIGYSLIFACILAVFSFSLAQLTIHYNYYQGLGRAYQRNYLQLGLEGFKLVLISIFAFYALVIQTDRFYLDNESVAGIFMIATLLVWLVSEYLLRKELRIGELKKPTHLVKGIFKIGFWAQSGQLIQFLNYRLSLMLISKMLGLAETGIYSNTLLIADSIWIFGNSFGTIAHMRMIRSENKKFRADLVLRYASIALAGTVVAVICMVLVPNAVYNFVFGIDFNGLKSTAIWFIPAILALGLSTVFSHYLHATNQFKTLLLANLTGLLFQFISGWIFIPRLGLKGACIAADLGFGCILLFILVVFKKQNPGSNIKGVFRLNSIRKIALNMFR
jgi:O-antigen/teichoic acid export membrane protein